MATGTMTATASATTDPLAESESESFINPDLESALAEKSDADAAEWDLTQVEREHYEKIKWLNGEVIAAQIKYDRAKLKAKSAKDELEDVSMNLSELITRGLTKPDPQKDLPFADDNVPAVDPDAWKWVAITEVLKLTTAQREKLEAAGVTTVGRLEFVRGGQDPDFPRGLKSIKGFGEKTIDAIENDIVEWLGKNMREA